MRLNEISYDGARPIDSYGPGFFRIDGALFEGAAIVTARGVASWGGLTDAQTLLALAGEVDVIFVGVGASVGRLPAELRQALEEVGLGVEAMDTPAACRTYNVLLSEGRRIAAALIPV